MKQARILSASERPLPGRTIRIRAGREVYEVVCLAARVSIWLRGREIPADLDQVRTFLGVPAELRVNDLEPLAGDLDEALDEYDELAALMSEPSGRVL